MFKFLVLGFLRDRLPHHGYALAKGYSEQSGADISTGKFYRELQRLVDEGLIHTVANPADADSRRSRNPRDHVWQRTLSYVVKRRDRQSRAYPV